MHKDPPATRYLTFLFTTVLFVLALSIHRSEAKDRLSGTADGLTVYLGVVPAEITKGPPTHTPAPEMHGRVPHGAHEYHFLAAVFNVASGARISDATVTAQVSGVGLSGPRKTLEPMQIAGTTTYGNFFDLPGRDLYTVRLTIESPGAARVVVMDFKYDHSR
jgi:hypothetical protein